MPESETMTAASPHFSPTQVDERSTGIGAEQGEEEENPMIVMHL